MGVSVANAKVLQHRALRLAAQVNDAGTGRAMNAADLRRYIDDLLRGRRPRPFQPDDFEAAQIRTAIELRAARARAPTTPEPGVPRRSASPTGRAASTDALATKSPAPPSADPPTGHRRHVGRGGRCRGSGGVGRPPRHRRRPERRPRRRRRGTHAQRRALERGRGQFGRARRCHASVRPRRRSTDSCDGSTARRRRVGGVHPPGLPAVVRRARRPAALPVPFDVVLARPARCSPTRMPIAPKPLPALQVREADGVIEVFAPLPPDHPANP